MKFVPNSVSRQVATQTYRLGKHSPRILLVAGIAAGIGATVYACKSTLKLEATLEEMDAETELMNAQNRERVNAPEIKYSQRQFKRDQVWLYTQHAAKIVKLYAPAIALGAVSVACLTKSHTILSSRNANLTMAYAATEKALREYRERVQGELGEEKEKEIFYGVKETTETITTEDGKKKDIKVKRPTTASMYARFYDEFAKNWQPDPEANRIFIINQERWANDKLHAQGHLFLNEVYDMLGLERTKAGQFVGWTLLGSGNGYVNFHLYDGPNAKDFVNGYENSVLLDFNVDGPIADLI